VAAATDTPAPTTVEGPVVEQIGPEGGTVAGPDEVRVIVPEGAFARAVEIRVARATAIPELPDKHGATPAGPAYALDLLQEVELQDMIELVLPLERQGGVDESRYTVLRWDGASWSDVGGLRRGRCHSRAIERRFPLSTGARPPDPPPAQV
jgi:hypothetical protein